MLHYVRMRIQTMARSERGASAVEYGLLVALIAIAIVVGAGALGGALDGLFQNTADDLPDGGLPAGG
jgi:pilus assembly protein Flp/PilA